MQVLSATFGMKDALGGTLRQLLAAQKSIDFNNTAYVDLGDLNWRADSRYGFYAQISDMTTIAQGAMPNMLCTSRKTVGWESLFTTSKAGIYVSQNANYVGVDSSLTDVESLKAAMKGVLVAYEKESS